MLKQRGILNAEEVQCLKTLNNNLSESIWTWHTAIVMMLHKRGLIKSEYTLQKLLDVVRLGRSGAALILSRVPIYFHSLLVISGAAFRVQVGIKILVISALQGSTENSHCE